MAIFRYIAETSEGRKKRGQIVGLSEPDALVRLRKMDLNPISVTNITGTLESKISMMIAPIKAKELVVLPVNFPL